MVARAKTRQLSRNEAEAARERQLVQAAQRDPVHFAELYEQHFELVYSYVTRRVRDRSATEDLTSDVFQRALAGLPRFEWRGAPFGAWLLRIAANAIIDWSKRSEREQPCLDANGDHQSGASSHANSEPGGTSYLEDAERRARLFQLVERLPEDQRRVVAMRFADEKSIAEIARDLGRTPGAVKQLQFRALQKLRAWMEESHG